MTTRQKKYQAQIVPQDGSTAYDDGFTLKDNPHRTERDRQLWRDQWRSAKNTQGNWDSEGRR